MQASKRGAEDRHLIDGLLMLVQSLQSLALQQDHVEAISSAVIVEGSVSVVQTLLPTGTC